MAIKSLPDADHVVRHVPSKLLDENGLPFPQAFELRPNETYLSTSWSEFFSGVIADRLAGVACLMSHNRKVKPRDAFALGNVGEIKDASADFDLKIRIVSEPDPAPSGLNLAYAAIRQIRTENIELLELLAQDVWNDVHSAAAPMAKVGPWRKR
jgi:hypothetical protein